jgi:hypothetical protein
MVVWMLALIINWKILGLLPLSETTLVPVNHLAGVLKKIHSNKNTYTHMVAKKKYPN